MRMHIHRHVPAQFRVFVYSLDRGRPSVSSSLEPSIGTCTRILRCTRFRRPPPASAVADHGIKSSPFREHARGKERGEKSCVWLQAARSRWALLRVASVILISCYLSALPLVSFTLSLSLFHSVCLLVRVINKLPLVKSFNPIGLHRLMRNVPSAHAQIENKEIQLLVSALYVPFSYSLMLRWISFLREREAKEKRKKGNHIEMENFVFSLVRLTRWEFFEFFQNFRCTTKL